jgi:hypothetical protein
MNTSAVRDRKLDAYQKGLSYLFFSIP